MECPKCHFEHPLQTSECMKCGLIFAKYEPGEELPDASAAPVIMEAEPPVRPEELLALCHKAQHEFLCRAFALPGALLFGWLLAEAMPMLAAFLHMWTHEGGHAVAAWLCGYVAIPTGWFTIVMPERHRVVSLLLGGGVIFGGYVAWRVERWFWVAASGCTLLLVIAGATRTDFQANALIIFFGDAGAFVLATVMMATFYARPESTMRKRQVRWGMIVLGAIAFMYGYAIWAGGYEKISEWLNDFDERGPSDLQQLTEMYGWGIGQMQVWFFRVAHWCFAALAAMYAAGLWQAWQKKAELAKDDLTVAKSAAAGD
jgi:hypothetical protein